MARTSTAAFKPEGDDTMSSATTRFRRAQTTPGGLADLFRPAAADKQEAALPQQPGEPELEEQSIEAPASPEAAQPSLLATERIERTPFAEAGRSLLAEPERFGNALAEADRGEIDIEEPDVRRDFFPNLDIGQGNELLGVGLHALRGAGKDAIGEFNRQSSLPEGFGGPTPGVPSYGMDAEGAPVRGLGEAVPEFSRSHLTPEAYASAKDPFGLGDDELGSVRNDLPESGINWQDVGASGLGSLLGAGVGMGINYGVGELTDDPTIRGVGKVGGQMAGSAAGNATAKALSTGTTAGAGAGALDAAASGGIGAALGMLMQGGNPNTKYYNEGERNTAMVMDTLASLLSYLGPAGWFAPGISAAIQSATGMGREGRNDYHRMSGAYGVLDRLTTALGDLGPENMDEVFGRPLEMAPQFDPASGKFRVSRGEAASNAGQSLTMDPTKAYQQARDEHQRALEEGGQPMDIQERSNQLMAEYAKQFEGEDEFGFDDPRSAEYSQQPFGSVGSFLASLAPSAAGEVPAYLANYTPTAPGFEVGQQGRLNSPEEIYKYLNSDLGPDQEADAAAGVTQNNPLNEIFKVLSYYDQLRQQQPGLNSLMGGR